MTNMTEKYSKLMQDMMEAVPMDDTALQAIGKVQSQMADQMTKAVLEAVEKSTDVSTKWTQASLEKTAQLAKASDHPSGHLHTVTDFFSLTTEMATDYFNNYSEIAKQLQLETIKIMLSTPNDLMTQATTEIEDAVVISEAPAPAKEAGAAPEAAVTKPAAPPSSAPAAQDGQPTQKTAAVQKTPTPPKPKA